jgi:hypothetical protein
VLRIVGFQSSSLSIRFTFTSSLNGLDRPPSGNDTADATVAIGAKAMTAWTAPRRALFTTTDTVATACTSSTAAAAAAAGWQFRHR